MAPDILENAAAPGHDAAAPGLAMLQFLRWVAERPRSYGEAMEAWRSTCPRLSVWEDAAAEGLVRVEDAKGGARRSRVALTERGRALLGPR
jgi:hypothetical protein